mgnify:FL=1
MPHILKLLLIIAIFFLVHCASRGGPEPIPEMIASDRELPLSLGELVHSRWKMVAFHAMKRGELVGTDTGGDGEISIAFSDRRISGFAGCNTFSASVLVNNHRRITVGPIATTRKHCPAKMALEQRLLQVLSEAYSYQLKAKLMLLYSDQDVLLATFRPQSSKG